jgi:hypothetical protein
MWNIGNQTTHPYTYTLRQAKEYVYTFDFGPDRKQTRDHFERVQMFGVKLFLSTQDEFKGWVDVIALEEIRLGFESLFPTKAPWETN